MNGAPKIFNVSREVTTQGRFVIRQLRLDMINLYTKCEVAMFTHYEDIKAMKNAKIGVVLGVRCHPWSSETLPFDRWHMTSDWTLVETMHLSCTVFELRSVLR